jgi:hypothetical protein
MKNTSFKLEIKMKCDSSDTCKKQKILRRAEWIEIA